MNQYYVYILLCNDKSYYTGVTNNLENRLSEHQVGLYPESYTYRRRPCRIMFFENFPQIKQAIDFEKQIKGWNRKKKEALIERNWEKIKNLSVCRNESYYKNFIK